MRGVTRRQFLGLGGALAASAAFGCAPVMHDQIRRPPEFQVAEQAGGGAGAPAVAQAAQAQTSGYSSQTNPFELNDSMRTIVREVGTAGDAQAKLQRLFSRLHAGAAGGVRVMDMSGRPPRTAAEALAQGGDCTDLANIAIPLMRELGIPGGAMEVHFDSAAAGMNHMVPYAEISGRRIIVDLQASTLGQTAQGNYSTVLAMTFGQAASMYHREMGDYLRDQGRSEGAIAAYEAAAAAFSRDPYVHQNLGVLYERAGQMASAEEHFRLATQIDSRYARDAQRAGGNSAAQRFNASVDQAERAFREQRWADCARHFQEALDSGAQVADDVRRSIQANIQTCRSQAGQ
ncbi:MAG: hypothetical protein AB1324_07695 [Candidatus Micrarchaeota archaeon]